MGERRGTKALELWCRRITEGYHGVNVQNMTTSWRDGLAFCAMIHHFRPDLINFDDLDKNDVYGNNELAFRVAEQHLGIPALLDAEDMASCSVPDRLSILTYLSQFYQTFSGSSPTRLAMNRATETVDGRITQMPESPKEKEASCLGMRKDLCAVCGLPVFLAEKLVLDHVAYHRTCFRCARCSNQLTLGNYYETEEGQHCCETCPDEEIPSFAIQSCSDSITPDETEKDIMTDSTYTRPFRDNENVDERMIYLTLPINDNYEEQGKQEEKCDFHGASSIAEALSVKGTVQGTSGDCAIMKNHDHDKLNVNGKKQKEELTVILDQNEVKEKSMLRDNTKVSLSETIDECTNAKSSLSLVQKRRMMFESMKDHVETNDTKHQSTETCKFKIQPEEHDVTERKYTSLPNSSDATKVVDSYDGLRDNAENFCSEKGEKSPNITAPSELSLPHESMVFQSSSIHSSDKGNSVDQALVKVNLKKDYPEDLNPFRRQEILMERPTKRRLAAPQINLNPFWSDEDDQHSDVESNEKPSDIVPIPKPRTIKHVQEMSTHEQKSDHHCVDLHVSSSSLRSTESKTRSGGTYRKKKPAPLPPDKKEQSLSNQRTSSLSKLLNNPAGYDESSSHTMPKARKIKPAPPPPPISTSTPSNASPSSIVNFEESPIGKSHNVTKENNIWEEQKTNKDEANRNRQNCTNSSCEENFHHKSYVDKSMEGKWKRKKGPAPPCPIPHRRKIKVMSLKDVKFELDEIEMQQQGLEKQGVRLEQLIRSKCESGSRNNDVSLDTTDVEELIMELFALVNEKNELFRRQAELMLLRRQQRLEEEHAEIEYQIRCLMSQHESTKTDFDKQREEALIQRLIKIVERRNEIVDCLEMDRRREMEEDRSIHRHMDLFAARNKSEPSNNDKDTVERKKRKPMKLKEKVKEKQLRKTLKKDMDKDVDEIELKLKRHTKRKWF
ncbi:MICAL-like protein 2 [Habropoda laboriosa]|uniref:MICAL-like protein 2 n=1 Tax=Habropoda laboriosa TaxID=597456 RepID=A0A0L7R178_9HYME|nr:MICAL-like protein 2 [Habropoda laboriosa]